MNRGLSSLINNLSMLEKMYDVIRVVDPIKKKTIHYDKGDIEISDNSCYDFWRSESFCPNCISIRAYNDNDTYVKIEYNKEKIYMVMASPVVIEDDKFVFELLKDVTDTGIIENINSKSSEEIQSFINDMNDKIIKDELTQTYNRRFIFERLPIDILSSRSVKLPMSIIMTDIDFFRTINNNYGHVAGDFALHEFATLIKNSIRKDSDWVARYGGEEFTIVLNNTDNNTAFQISEKIRKKVESRVFEFNGNKINITSSFGIYTLDKDNYSMDIEEVINHADRNLYKAKKAGRNKSIK